MSRLWKDFGGEPFLINPRLFIVNSPRSKKRMSSKKHRRKPRRNWVSSGAIANPKGRHHRRPRRNFIRWNAHRRRTRRNPPSLMRVAGIALPSLETIGFASVGLLGAPALEGFLTPYVPDALKNNAIGRYAVRIASVIGLSYAAKAIAGPKAAETVAIAGSAYVVGTAVQEFFPTLLPGMHGYTDSLGFQPFLGAPRATASRSAGTMRRGFGAYRQVAPFPSASGRLGTVAAGRLDPAARF